MAGASHSLVVDGVRIVYDTVGNAAGARGLPVLFLHEMTATKDEWEHQMAYFSPNRLVIAPNAVGYPPSDVPDDVACYAIERQVANALAVLRELGVPRAHVVGHSMGAHTALEFALRHPDVAASTVIVGGGSGQLNRAGFREQCLKKADELERDGMKALVDYASGINRKRFEMRDHASWKKYMDAVQTKHSPKGRANTLRGFQAARPSWYEQEAELKKCQVPALVVTGDEDMPCVEPGLYLKKTMPRCGILVMPQTGHTVQVEEHPRFNQLLGEFFGDVEASTPRWAELTGFTTDPFSASFQAAAAQPKAPLKLKGPLDGIVVVDLTRILAGPFCTRILRDLGARIIKVEDPAGGDITRNLQPFADTPERTANSAYFAQVNTGKECITLNMKAKADLAIFDKLLEGADVLIENYRPGVIARMGYGWPEVHKKHPRLVMASISGFGQTGPMSQLGAVDPIIQAMSGIVSLTGPVGSSGVKVGASVSDVVAGIYGANGIQAALLGRERTQQGSYVDISMLDCSVTLNTIEVGQYYVNGGVIPRPMGNAHKVAAPQDIFRCGGDTVILIAASADKDFKKMCKLIGRDDIFTDKRFQGNANRLKNAGELKEELEKALSSKTSKEWCDLFMANQVPCGPVMNIEEMSRHPQIKARNMVINTDDGKFLVTGNPIKISGYDDISSRPAPPGLNAHNEQVRSRL